MSQGLFLLIITQKPQEINRSESRLFQYVAGVNNNLI